MFLPINAGYKGKWNQGSQQKTFVIYKTYSELQVSDIFVKIDLNGIFDYSYTTKH